MVIDSPKFGIVIESASPRVIPILLSCDSNANENQMAKR